MIQDNLTLDSDTIKSDMCLLLSEVVSLNSVHPQKPCILRFNLLYRFRWGVVLSEVSPRSKFLDQNSHYA